MAKYLICKLEQFTRLSAEDKQALEQAASERVRSFGLVRTSFTRATSPGM